MATYLTRGRFDLKLGQQLYSHDRNLKINVTLHDTFSRLQSRSGSSNPTQVKRFVKRLVKQLVKRLMKRFAETSQHCIFEMRQKKSRMSTF